MDSHALVQAVYLSLSHVHVSRHRILRLYIYNLQCAENQGLLAKKEVAELLGKDKVRRALTISTHSILHAVASPTPHTHHLLL